MKNSDHKNEVLKFKSMLKDFGWKYKDVAEITGFTINTVKVRLSQGLPSWMKLAVAVYQKTKSMNDLDVRKRVTELLEEFNKETGTDDV